MNLIQYFKDNQNLLLATVIVFVIAIILFVAVILINKYIRAKRAYKEQLNSATEALSKLPHSEAQNDLFLDPVLCEETKLNNQPDVNPQDEVTNTDENRDVVRDDDKISENTSSDDSPVAVAEPLAPTKKEEESPSFDNGQSKENGKKQSSQKQTEKKPDKFTPTRSTNKSQDKPVKYSGKWLIYTEGGRYGANLVASNGEVLLRTETYTALSGIKSGIETIKNNVEKNNFAISLDKNGNFFFKLYSSSTRLLCISEGYSTKAVCESAIESVKRFSKTAVIEIKKEEKPSNDEA